MELDEFDHMHDTTCPYCGRTNDLHREVKQEGVGPSPGDVSVCFGCVGVSVYDENLALRIPTDEEFAEVIEVARPMQALIHYVHATE
jgi:hypothetical protein